MDIGKTINKYRGVIIYLISIFFVFYVVGFALPKSLVIVQEAEDLESITYKNEGEKIADLLLKLKNTTVDVEFIEDLVNTTNQYREFNQPVPSPVVGKSSPFNQ